VTPVAVVSVAHGNLAALAAQITGLRAQSTLPDLHVVVALEDPELEFALGEHTASLDLPWKVEVLKVPAPGERGLPYAAAYNAGVTTALEDGAGIVALLDPGCVPLSGFVAAHRGALEPRLRTGNERPVLSCGPVRTLEPGGRSGSLRTSWSRAFATTAASWARVGGFDDAYLGHAGGDLDLGERFAEAAGTVLWLDDGAVLLHDDGDDAAATQARDLVDNANRFARRWGRRPFAGRLAELEELGLVARGDDGYVVSAFDPAAVG
jgi:N-acetylglucosaminyl-diphospho-decaprenol L-rhamnosyltransferase